MLLESLQIDPAAFARRTGWAIKPEGACKGDRCVPLPAASQLGLLPVQALAERLGIPLIHDAASGLWCLGPESGGPALADAQAPDFALPDLAGQTFLLRSLRGRKVLLVAWASW